MPFTVSHALAAMPFIQARWLRLDPTCLVIGTMAPDFEYFARVKLAATISHTLPGLVIWCLPVTLFSAWLFHWLVKWPVVRAAPERLAGRLAAYAERPWIPTWSFGALASVVVSSLVGAVTHLVWDSFTHADMWGTQHIAVLTEVYEVPMIGRMPVHRILQHGCSLVGLVALAWLAARALHRVQPVPVETRGRARLLVLVGVAAALAYGKMLHNHETDAGSLIVAPLCGLIYGSLAAGIAALAWRPAVNADRGPHASPRGSAGSRSSSRRSDDHSPPRS